MTEHRQKQSMNFAIAAAAIFIVAAACYRLFVPAPVPNEHYRVRPVVEKEGTEHSHASMLIMIGNEPVNFCEPKFMLRSTLVHFEDDRCDTIHKHARGITYPFFFTTIGVKLTNDCILLPSRERYCTEGDKKISVVINGKEVTPEDLDYIEIRNNDHILVNYGNETGALLMFKYNQVPDVPMDVSPPKEIRELEQSLREQGIDPDADSDNANGPTASDTLRLFDRSQNAPSE